MKSKLNLRDLFWLTLVVGITLGWFVHYRFMRDDLEVARKASRKVIVTELALRSMGFVVDQRGTVHKLK